MSRDIWPICHRPAPDSRESRPHGTDHIHSFEDFEDSPENPTKLNHGVPDSYFQVKDIRARSLVTPEKSS